MTAVGTGKPSCEESKERIRELEKDLARERRKESPLESESNFKALVESAPFGISITKPDLTFEYFNPKFTEIFGYTVEDVPDRQTWFNKVYPDKKYRDRVFSTWKERFISDTRSGERERVVFRARCKDGQDKIVEIRDVALKDGILLATYLDTTPQAKAEDSLRESEDRLQSIFAAVQTGILIIDKETHEISDVNPSAIKMIGAPKWFRALSRLRYHNSVPEFSVGIKVIMKICRLFSVKINSKITKSSCGSIRSSHSDIRNILGQNDAFVLLVAKFSAIRYFV